METSGFQFSIRRALHATFWFAVAAAAFGVKATLDDAHSAGTNTQGLLILAGLVASGIGIGLLCGRGAFQTARGRSILSLMCASASLALKAVSLHFADRGMRAGARGQFDIAYGYAAQADWYGGPVSLLAIVAVALALYARSAGRGRAQSAALICAAMAMLFQLLLV